MNFEANSVPGIEIIYSLGQTKTIVLSIMNGRFSVLCHWCEKQYDFLFFTEVEKSYF